MTTIQTLETPSATNAIAEICEQYDVDKLIKTTIPGDYVVFYRKDRPGPGMSKYLQLERSIAEATGQPADLIASGAPCISWPKYQKAINNGIILYQR